MMGLTSAFACPSYPYTVSRCTTQYTYLFSFLVENPLPRSCMVTIHVCYSTTCRQSTSRLSSTGGGGADYITSGVRADSRKTSRPKLLSYGEPVAIGAILPRRSCLLPLRSERCPRSGGSKRFGSATVSSDGSQRFGEKYQGSASFDAFETNCRRFKFQRERRW